MAFVTWLFFGGCGLALLVYLVSAKILTEVWGPAYAKETHYLRVYMAQLRRKLEHDPAAPVHLLTEAGMGYRFAP